MSDLTSLPDQWPDAPTPPEPRRLSPFWWGLIGLAFCLLLIAVGAYVLGHVGLEGVRPPTPKDLYYGS